MGHALPPDDAEGLVSIINLANSPHVEVQQYVAAALRNMTVDGAAQVRVVNENGIHALILLARSTDPEVLRNVAATLRNLTVNDDIETQIVADGGLRPLIMLARSKDLEVQRDAAGALRNLSVNAANQERILHTGGLQPLLSLCHTDSRDLVVHRDAAAALRNLTVNGENHGEFIRLGGLAAVIALASTSDLEVQQHASAALLNLSVVRANQKHMIQEGGLQPLIAMARAKADPDVHRFSASALLHISEDPANKKLLEQMLSKKARAKSRSGPREPRIPEEKESSDAVTPHEVSRATQAQQPQQREQQPAPPSSLTSSDASPQHFNPATERHQQDLGRQHQAQGAVYDGEEEGGQLVGPEGSGRGGYELDVLHSGASDGYYPYYPHQHHPPSPASYTYPPPGPYQYAHNPYPAQDLYNPYEPQELHAQQQHLNPEHALPPSIAHDPRHAWQLGPHPQHYGGNEAAFSASYHAAAEAYGAGGMAGASGSERAPLLGRSASTGDLPHARKRNPHSVKQPAHSHRSLRRALRSSASTASGQSTDEESQPSLRAKAHSKRTSKTESRLVESNASPQGRGLIGGHKGGSSMRAGDAPPAGVFLTALPDDPRLPPTMEDEPVLDDEQSRPVVRGEHKPPGRGGVGATATGGGVVSVLKQQLESAHAELTKERLRSQDLQAQVKRLERQVGKQAAEITRLQDSVRMVESRAKLSQQAIDSRIRDLQLTQHRDKGRKASDPHAPESKRRTVEAGQLAQELKQSKVELTRMQHAMAKLQHLLDSAVRKNGYPAGYDPDSQDDLTDSQGDDLALAPRPARHQRTTVLRRQVQQHSLPDLTKDMEGAGEGWGVEEQLVAEQLLGEHGMQRNKANAAAYNRNDPDLPPQHGGLLRHTGPRVSQGAKRLSKISHKTTRSRVDVITTHIDYQGRNVD